MSSNNQPLVNKWEPPIRALSIGSEAVYQEVNGIEDSGSEICCISPQLCDQLCLLKIRKMRVFGIPSTEPSYDIVKVNVDMGQNCITIEAAVVPDLYNRIGAEFLIGHPLLKQLRTSVSHINSIDLKDGVQNGYGIKDNKNLENNLGISFAILTPPDANAVRAAKQFGCFSFLFFGTYFILVALNIAPVISNLWITLIILILQGIIITLIPYLLLLPRADPPLSE